jgi:hypothetical protein
LNSNILERLIQKTSQIENVSRIRDRLRKSPDVSTGMDLILEGALKDLEMDAGAVLVFDVKEDVADVRAFKSMTKEITLNPNYPPCRVSECEVLALDKPVSKREGISCILGTNSIHCAPIHFGKEVYGALLLGSQKTSTLDDSGLAVLRMYAELASTVFETQRLTITPVKEESIVSERRFELEFGGVYLAKNEVERAFNIFADGVLGGLEGLCVTRIFPPTVRRKHGLEKTPIVWLTPERVEGHMTVNSLQDLSILIGNFLEKTTRSIVLLDGIEYLITNHGFESFIRFLQLNRSRIEQKESILIVPILEEAIDAKDARLIERETIALMAN